MNVIGGEDRGEKKLKKLERLLAAFKLANRKNKIMVKYAMMARKLLVKGFDVVRDSRAEVFIIAMHEK